MTPEFQRAQHLRNLGRHEEAVAILHSHLAHHPDHSMGYIELAINRMNMDGQLANALEDAKRATGLLPSESYPLALQSRILSRLDREKEALPMAESAIALDPDCDYAWSSKAIALIGLSRWKEAEECLLKALEIDPDSETASNLLSHALRMQNRLDESEGESRRRLARDPENPFSFANSGWAALQRGQIKEAEALFREALRLDPNMEYARDGLKQSYRARSTFFRLFLKWAFFMQRFSEGNQIAITIGMIIGFKVLRALFASVNPILVIPLAIAYYLFVFGTWLTSQLEDDMQRKGLSQQGAFALAHNVGSAEEVDAVIAALEAAGGRVLRQGDAPPHGGYRGYVADPDDHAWEIAWNPDWPIDAEGRITFGA